MKIAIIGKMCSGKSTIAQMILEHDSRYRTFSFGGAVKRYAKEIFNMQGKDRSLLINFANKMREIDSEVWINYVVQQCKDVEFCLIDDLRYQNEYEALIKNGFKIIQLNISDELQEERIKNIYPNNYEDHLSARNHLSELNKFNWLSHDHPHLSIDSSTPVEDIKNLVKEFISLV